MPGESPAKKRHSLRRHRENLEQMSSPVLKSVSSSDSSSSADVSRDRLSLRSPRNSCRSTSLPDVLSPRSELAQRKARRRSAKESPASSTTMTHKAATLTRLSLKHGFAEEYAPLATNSSIRKSATLPLSASSLAPLDPAEIDFLRRRSPRRALSFDEDSKSLSSPSSISHKRHSDVEPSEETRSKASRSSSSVSRVSTESSKKSSADDDGFSVPPNPLRRQATSERLDAVRSKISRVSAARDRTNDFSGKQTIKEVSGSGDRDGSDGGTESPHVSKSEKVFRSRARVSDSDDKGRDSNSDSWLALRSPPTPARHSAKTTSVRGQVRIFSIRNRKSPELSIACSHR